MYIIVAKPRGFCAGVERAIQCVELALMRYGKPIYVLNHIVHNRHVVNTLTKKGAVFVKRIADVPEGSILLFSAHGVSPKEWESAKAKKIKIIDATCPLVEKVHNKVKKFTEEGYEIIYIGDAGHDETKGTMGWAKNNIHLIQNEDDAKKIDISNPSRLAVVTQTTLSVDDYSTIVDILKQRFPKVKFLHQSNICYATTNRQKAVKTLAMDADLVLVVGDQESANSQRLVEIAKKLGKPSYLVLDAGEINPEWFHNKKIKTILVTSGASVPEEHVQGVLRYLTTIEPGIIEEIEVVSENLHFTLPQALR